MVKIALLDSGGIVTTVQYADNLTGIIEALKLNEDEYVEITSREIPVTSGKNEVVKYNRNTDTFEIIEVEVVGEPNEPTNAEVAQMISDLQADLIIAGVI